LIALLPLIAHAQRVALTFDDGLNPQKTPDAAGWNHAILGALAEAGVKSILFAASRQPIGDGSGARLGSRGTRRRQPYL
jgi:peptidoglycan/xylan/chitin deacetylase (PgdA/CDA1 family)